VASKYGKTYGIEFDVQGLAEAVDMLRAMPDTVRNTSKKHMDTLSKEGERLVKSETPVDSGKLKKSTGRRKKGAYGFEIYQTAIAGAGRGKPNYFYGRGVRSGTRGQYSIQPRNKHALYWGAKKGSRGLKRPISAVGVNKKTRVVITDYHPGIQKPFNYVDAAVSRLQPKIAATSKAIVADVTQAAYKRFKTRTIK